MDLGRFRKSKSEQKKPDPWGDATRLAGLPYGSQLSPAEVRIVEAGNRSVLLSRLRSQSAEVVAERYKVGDRIGGLYEVLDIHLGSMGVVYATFDHEERLPRALKTLQQRFAGNRTLRDLFTEEASVWVRLEKHPFIVRAYLAEVIDGQPYVITEYIRGQEGMGGDLRAWLGHPKLSLPVAVEMALQIAQGMQHATRKVPGLVHRDLKPANVLVNDRGQSLVTDFGLVFAGDACAGTPAYMAPEQWFGGGLDQRTDIYAYGCILYEMFTGHRVFGARSVDEWKSAHLGQMPVSPQRLRGGLPAELEEFPMRCLAKDTAQRPSSWDEVVDECAWWFRRLTGQPVVLNFGADELTKDELNTASYSLSELGKYPEALEVCERALAVDETDAWAWGQKGFLLGRMGRAEEGLAAYDRALDIDPADAGTWREKGHAFRSLGRMADAATAYDRALAINPGDADTWEDKSFALFMLHRGEEALAAYEQALTIDPNRAAWNNKGAILEQLGRAEEALAAYERALAIDPDNEFGWQCKGRVLEKLEHYEEALAAYERALAIDPDDEFGWQCKGCVLEKLEHYEEALAAYERALTIDPNDPTAWYNKGVVLEKLGRAEQALAAYEEALAIDPDEEDAAAWDNRGLALQKLGRVEDALAAYERALTIDPDDATTWYNKGVALQDLRRHDEALAAYDRALAIKSDDANTWGNRGTALFRAGRAKEALDAHDRALAIDPNRATGWRDKGAVLLHMGRVEESVSALDRALAIDPNDASTWVLKGAALLQPGRMEEALAAFDRALAIDPTSAATWCGKGVALQKLGRAAEALTAYDHALAIDPNDAATWTVRGAVLQNLGRGEEALAAYERALAIDPNHVLARSSMTTLEQHVRQTDTSRSREAGGSRAVGQGEALSGGGSAHMDQSEATEDWRERSQGLLDEAAEESRRLKHGYLGVEHLFIALTQASLFPVFGLDAAEVRDAIRRETGSGKGAAEGFPPLTPRLVAVLRRADQHAGVGSPLSEGHVLRALFEEGQSLPLRYLASIGCPAASCLTRLESTADSDSADHTRLAAGPEAAVPTSVPTPALDQWGRDLCKLARLRKLADVTGRDNEIQQIVTVLARTQKSNPLLLGEAGVGKTAVVEGLAWRIAQGQVPPVLRGRRIVEIDMASLTAGTTLRGQFEERLKQVISEAAKAPEVILFIDEIHSVVGAGDAVGAVDAGQIFKPPLARGDISCIGATTQDEYARFIRKDPALERRFSPISIKELTPTAALAVLRAVAPLILEKQALKGQRLQIVPEALKAAVTLTSKYVKDRRQPDKSIDAIDIACARAVVSGRNLVTADDVALVVSEWAGIPAGRLTSDEQQRYAGMEAALAERVIGQDAAVSAVSRSIRAAMAGMKPPNRPIGVFLFLGPSGVGKTHLAKELAAFLFNTTDALIRFDMNEYQEKHTVSNLIGSPRGYFDSERSGQFTEALRRRPYSVVLLDEIEKAHPDVLNLFLAVFDEGRITDNLGRVVDCSNAVFILTSNMGGETIGFTATEAADLRNLALQTMRPELVNRITEIVRFLPLGRQELARILDRILAEKTESFRGTQGITVTVEESVREVILGTRFDPRMGARPLERAVEALVVQPLVDAIFAGEISRGEVRATAKSGKILFTAGSRDGF